MHALGPGGDGREGTESALGCEYRIWRPVEIMLCASCCVQDLHQVLAYACGCACDVGAVTVASQLSVWHVCTVQCGAVVMGGLTLSTEGMRRLGLPTPAGTPASCGFVDTRDETRSFRVVMSSILED